MIRLGCIYILILKIMAVEIVDKDSHDRDNEIKMYGLTPEEANYCRSLSLKESFLYLDLIRTRNELQKEWVITPQQSEFSKKLDPREQYAYFKAVKKLLSYLSNWNTLTPEEAESVKLIVDPRQATKYAEAIIFRNHELSYRDDLTPDEKQKIMEISPIEAVEYLISETYKVEPWDTLWSIITKRLWNNPTNREIANEIIFIWRLNPSLQDTLKFVDWVLEKWKDWIPGDVLKVWDVIRVSWTRKEITDYAKNELLDLISKVKPKKK